MVGSGRFRHNDDGSYTYGYESADGSFKIETKLPTGEVKGKYGYVDDVGKVRVIEYGATKNGFAPAGEGNYPTNLPFNVNCKISFFLWVKTNLNQSNEKIK